MFLLAFFYPQCRAGEQLVVGCKVVNYKWLLFPQLKLKASVTINYTGGGKVRPTLKIFQKILFVQSRDLL